MTNWSYQVAVVVMSRMGLRGVKGVGVEGTPLALKKASWWCERRVRYRMVVL